MCLVESAEVVPITTRFDPESDQTVAKPFVELELECEHIERRAVTRNAFGDPKLTVGKLVACRGCSKRRLTSKELDRLEQPPPPRELEGLTLRQADLLRLARDTEGGCFVGVGSYGSVPDELVDGGAATWREVWLSGGTRSADDPRPCKWSELYLVPTELGLRLLEKP